MAKPTYTVQEILELAVAACDVNCFAGKNGYVKTGFVLDKSIKVPSKYNGVFNNEPYVFANRDLIKEALGLCTLSKWHPDRHTIPKLVVTDNVRATASAVLKHFKTLTFKAMSGKMNAFEQSVHKVITSDKVTDRDVGILASLPGTFHHEMIRKADLTHKKELALNSEYIGVVGDRVKSTIEIVTHKYIPRHDCYIVNAVDDNSNMIAFFTGKSADKFGTKCMINGTVKRIDRSKYNKGKETFLTRVGVQDVYEV